MNHPYKSYFSWSGGKDSALSLYHVLKGQTHDVELLLTSVNRTFRRVSMHGVRNELLERQADCLGLPLQKMELDDEPTMTAYNAAMQEVASDLKQRGFNHAIFGDIFLDDLRLYREQQLAQVGITAHFPIWKRDTAELMHEFIDLGFKTIVVCTKSELLDDSFAGRIIDRDFIKDLPGNVDPCGENGEFHTFVFDGPIFKKPVVFSVGEKVYREYKAPKNEKDGCYLPEPDLKMGFWFCDLLPG